METKKITMQKFIESLDYYELLQLKKEINQGELTVKDLVKERLESLKTEHMNDCATCSSEIDINNRNSYTLVFGPHDFKKKASFCGKDCMLYFINQKLR